MENKTKQHYVAAGCNPNSMTEYVRWGEALGWEVAGSYVLVGQGAGTTANWPTVTIIWKEVDPVKHPIGLPSFSNFQHR